MTDIVKENAKKLQKNNFKYYIGLVSGTKRKMLAASNSKSSVEKDAKEKLKELFDGKLEKLDKFVINLINIRKTTKEEMKKHKESKAFSLVGGILVMTIKGIKINIVGNQRIRFIYDEIKDVPLAFRIFLDNKFLKKNDEITEKEILKLVFFSKNGYWSAVSVVKASKFLKR